MWILAVIGLIVVAVIVIHVMSRFRHYGEIYSQDSFRELHQKVAAAIAAAQAKAPMQPPSPNDGTAFITLSGLVIGVTSRKDNDGSQTVHISMSMRGQLTTHSLCSQIGSFIAAMFGDAECQLSPFFSENLVHHLVFRFPTPVARLLDFEATYSRYTKGPRNIPFRQENLKGEPRSTPIDAPPSA